MPTTHPTTMKATHTPGPWKLRRTSYRIEVDIPSEPPSCYAFGLRDDANARLIAAAPELLEALKVILADHDKCVANEQPGFLTASQEQTARLAIARAEGRE